MLQSQDMLVMKGRLQFGKEPPQTSLFLMVPTLECGPKMVLDEGYAEKHVFAGPTYVTGVSENIHTGNKKVNVEVLEYYTYAAETYAEGENGEPMIWIVVSGNMSGRQNLYINKNEESF